MFHLISARQCCSQVLWMVASDGVNKRAGLNLNEPLSCSAGNSPLRSKRLAKAIQAHTSYQHVPLKEMYLFKAAQRVVMYAERELDLFSCSTCCSVDVWTSNSIEHQEELLNIFIPAGLTLLCISVSYGSGLSSLRNMIWNGTQNKPTERIRGRDGEWM